MYIAIGNSSWQKHEYDPVQCFNKWLDRAGHPVEGEVTLIQFNANMDAVTMDGIGNLSYPKDTEVGRVVISLSKHARIIERLGTLKAKVDDLLYNMDEAIGISDAVE